MPITTPHHLKKLGIIAGKGLLPATIADLYLMRPENNGVSKKDAVCIAVIDKEADISLISGYNYRSFSIGSVGAILGYFTENNVGDIVIIGGITRPDFRSIKADFVGSRLLARILKEKFLGDDNILKVIADFIESRDFRIISPQELLKASDYEVLYAGKRGAVSRQDKTDIEIGKRILTSLGELDVGQSVIVCDGYVLGIEAAEGTDNLIRRCELLKKNGNKKGGVLVKMSKTGQDLRFDMPTIGPDTIFYLAKHAYNGIAIEKHRVIIAKPDETMELIKKNNLFISYF